MGKDTKNPYGLNNLQWERLTSPVTADLSDNKEKIPATSDEIFDEIIESTRDLKDKNKADTSQE